MDQPAIGRARTVAVDRGNVTEGDWWGQGAVPRYVRLYRPALVLARWAVGRCESTVCDNVPSAVRVDAANSSAAWVLRMINW